MTVKRTWLDLWHEVEDLQRELAQVQAERDAALGCPHSGNCACAVTSRHEAFDWFCAEREKVKQAEARLAAVRALVEKMRVSGERLCQEVKMLHGWTQQEHLGRVVGALLLDWCDQLLPCLDGQED